MCCWQFGGGTKNLNNLQKSEYNTVIQNNDENGSFSSSINSSNASNSLDANSKENSNNPVKFNFFDNITRNIFTPVNNEDSNLNIDSNNNLDNPSKSNNALNCTNTNDEWVDVGDFEVCGDNNYSFNNGVLTITESTEGKTLKIKNINPDVATLNTITVKKDANANITLAGINIDTNDRESSALKIADNSKGNIRISLLDNTENFLKGDNHAALEKDCDDENKDEIGTLFIDSKDVKGNPTNGSLTAEGGAGGAGIGSSRFFNDVKNITFCGGKITAKGGEDAAGIGGGQGNDAENIVFYGGTINTKGGIASAGIGGGHGGVAKSVKVNGGTIEATSGMGGAGIGSSQESADSNEILIVNGIVTATGRGGGAGIGSGSYSKSINTVQIDGGIVTATAEHKRIGPEAAGIGSGRCKEGETAPSNNIYINGGSVLSNKIVDNVYNNSAKESVRQVYRMVIGNLNNEQVFIGDSKDPYTPCNHAAANPEEPDTNLYTYQSDNRLHKLQVKVGDKVISYMFKSGQWVTDSSFDTTFGTPKNKLENQQILHNTKVDNDINVNTTLAVPYVDVSRKKHRQL